MDMSCQILSAPLAWGLLPVNTRRCSLAQQLQNPASRLSAEIAEGKKITLAVSLCLNLAPSAEAASSSSSVGDADQSAGIKITKVQTSSWEAAMRRCVLCWPHSVTGGWEPLLLQQVALAHEAAALRGSGTEALRIVVISQLSGAVSAQRLNKALKINHSSFLGANSHSKLLQSNQSISWRHGLRTHLTVSCDSNTREREKWVKGEREDAYNCRGRDLTRR